MTSCSFCGSAVSPGTGILFIRNDAKLFHFCSSTCRKHQLVLGKKALRTTWVTKKLKSS